MASLEDIKKKLQQGQQQSQTQQGQQTQQKDESSLQTLKNKLSGNTQTIKPSQSLEESLKDVDKTTAFSTGQIKDLASKAGDFFSNIWHTVTDKDEEHGILDYSEYKRYKDILEAAPLGHVDLTPVYKQMADEGVIDYNKFTQWYETEGAKEFDKYYKFDKAVDAIKVNLDEKLGEALSPFMNQTEGSYQLNALTKAREVMNNQASMFIENFTNTYKNTRDNDLLKDFDDILNEYETSLVNFTRQWASNLTSKDQSGSAAYYDTLNDEGMLEYAKALRRIQFDMENKLTSAAMKSNFGDSWTALKNGNVVSAFSELLGAGMNGINWVLDKLIGGPTELIKNTTIGWYDVVEELANLNVYSNDAGALEKTFGTMASWMGDVLDAAPTLVPMVADIVVGSKAGIIGKGNNVSKVATKIDDAIGVIYKNQNAVKNIAKDGDLLINAANAGNLGGFPLQMLSRYLENKFIFDVAAQQFEGNPITDDVLVYNFLINLPIDTISAILPEGAKIIAKSLPKARLVTDVIDKDVFDMLSKHYRSFKKVFENGDKAAKEYDNLTKYTDKLTFDRSAINASEEAMKQGQEKYYMAQSLIERQGRVSKNTVNLNDTGLDEGLVNFIRQVQKDSQDVYDRLATFGGNIDDYIQEMEVRLTAAKKRGVSLEKLGNDYIRDLKSKNAAWRANEEHSRTMANIDFLINKLGNLENGRYILDRALDRVFPDGNPLKDLIRELVFKSSDKGRLAEILKKVNESPANQMSFDEISKKTQEVMAAFMTDNRELITPGDAPLLWTKQNDGTYRSMMTKEVLSEDELISKYGKDLLSAKAVGDSYLREFAAVNNAITFNMVDAYSVTDEGITQLSSTISGKTAFFDLTETFKKLGINLDKPQWKGKSNWQALVKNDSTAALYDKVYGNAGLRIVNKPDGTIGIFGTGKTIERLANEFDKIRKLGDDEEFKIGMAYAYKLMFMDYFEKDADKYLSAMDNIRLAEGDNVLSNTEKAAYGSNYKTFVEETVEVKEETPIEKAVRTKTGQGNLDQKSEDKLSKESRKELNKIIRDVTNGNATPQEAEHTAVKLLISEETSKTLVSSIDKQKGLQLELTIPERLSKKFQNLFEGHWTTPGDKATKAKVKQISDTFANVICNIANTSGMTLEPMAIGQLVDVMSEALGTVMLTPLTISKMADGGEDLIYTLIANVFMSGLKKGNEEQKIILNKGKGVAGLLFQRINEIVEPMIKGNANEQFLGKQTGIQLYQFSNALSNLYKQFIDDGGIGVSDYFMSALVAKVKPYIQGMSLNDFNGGLKQIEKNEKNLLFKKIKSDRLKEIIHSGIDTNNDIEFIDLFRTYSKKDYTPLINVDKLTDEEIEDIANIITYEQMRNSYIYSERLYNNLSSSIKDGLIHLRDDAGEKPPVLFQLYKGSSYKPEGGYINYGLLSDVQLLGHIDDKMLYENTIAHEMGHFKFHKEGELMSVAEATTEKADLNAQNGLYTSFINELIKGFDDAVSKSYVNKETQLALSNYLTKYNLKEYINSLNTVYNKDNLIEKLINDYLNGSVDKYNNARLLGNIMGENAYVKGTKVETETLNKKNILLLEEYINELRTFALAGKLDRKGMDALSKELDFNIEEGIEEALNTMARAAEVIDKFRCILVSKADMSANDLRRELGYVFDAFSINKAKNTPDTVAEQLLQGIEKAKANPREAAKSLADFINKVKLNIDSNTNIQDLTKEILTRLSTIENSPALQRQYKISEELAREFRGLLSKLKVISETNKNKDEELKLLFNDLNVENFVPKNNKAQKQEMGISHVRDVYFLDIGRTALDLQYENTLEFSAGRIDDSWINPVLRKTYNSKGEEKVGPKAKSKAVKESDAHKVPSLGNMGKVTENRIDEMMQYKISQAVPLIRTMATMGEDLGSMGTDVIGALKQFIGDVDKTIDMNMLLVGEETKKAYEAYTKTHNVTFGTFVLNKLVANVLGEMGMYNDETIELINNSLRNAIYDGMKESISGKVNKYNNKYFVRLFDYLKEHLIIQRGTGKAIKDTSNEAMAGVEPLLSEKERNKAFDEWKASGGKIDTIGRYYNFTRGRELWDKNADGKVRYKIDGVKREVDLQTYDGYVRYYNDWEVPMKYTERKNGDISAIEALRGATEGEMAYFNETICEYIDALKNGEGADEALENVYNAFMSLIDDAGTAAHENFRFMSAGLDNVATRVSNKLTRTSTGGKELKGLTKREAHKQNVANNITNSFLKSYEEKPIGVKAPTSVEEIILSLAKNVIESKGVKLENKDKALKQVALSMLSADGKLNTYVDEIEYLAKQINDVYKALLDEDEILSDLEVYTAEQADELIDDIWFKFVNRWNNKIADELGLKGVFTEAEENSYNTLEFLKNMTNDNVMSDNEFSLKSVSDVGDFTSKEELIDNGIDEEGKLMAGNVTSAEIGDNNVAIKELIEGFIPEEISRDSNNYKLVKDSNTFQIKENGIDKTAKGFSVNMGIVYNGLENPNEYNKEVQNALEIIKKKKKDYTKLKKDIGYGLNKQEQLQFDDAFEVYSKLNSYAEGNFVNGDIVKTMNLHGVNSVLGKTIGGDKVSYVQVVFKDGNNILFTKKGNNRVRRSLGDHLRDNDKTLVRFSTLDDDLSFLQTVYKSLLPEEGQAYGAEVRLLGVDGLPITTKSIDSNDVWRSFIGDEISSYLGLGGANKLDLSKMSSKDLYKQAGLKGGTDNVVNYNDIVTISDNLGGETVGVNNESMMNFIYQAIQKKLDNISVSSFLIMRKVGDAPQSYIEKQDMIRKIRDELRSKMLNAGYKVYSDGEGLFKKVMTLEIDAEPRMYNLDGTPFKYGHVSQLKGGAETDYKGHIKIMREYPDGHIEYDYNTLYKEDETDKYGTPTGKKITNKSYYVKVNDDKSEIPGTKVYLDNVYRPVGTKPKVEVLDGEGNVISSFFYNANKKGGYIPLDDKGNINSQLFWDSLDNKVLDTQVEGSTSGDLGNSLRVNREDGEIIVVLENEDGQQAEIGIKMKPDAYTNNGNTFTAYYAYFNNDTELGLGLADSGKAHDFYVERTKLINDTSGIDWDKVEGLSNKERNTIVQSISLLKELTNDIKNSIIIKNPELTRLANLSPVQQAEELAKKTPQEKIDFYSLLEKGYEQEMRDAAKRMEDARQLGDLSENAEYKQAIEDREFFSVRIKDIQKLRTKMKGNTFDDKIMVEDSVFMNGRDAIKYEYRMPLIYNRGAKLAEERGLLQGTEELDELAGKRHGGWKNNKDVLYKTYENGKEKYVYGELMDKEAYENYKIQEEEAKKLTKEVMDAKEKGINPNNIDNTIEVPDESMSLGDIIDGEIEEKKVPSLYETMLSDESVDMSVKNLIKDEYDLKTVGKGVKAISNTDVIRQVYSSSEGLEEIFNFSNIDILGGNNTLSQLRGANAEFRRVYGDELVRVSQNRNKAFGNLTDNEKKNLIKGINDKVNSLLKENKFKTDKVFELEDSEAKKIINDIASIFYRAGWNNVNILNKISNADSIDNLIYKTFNTYQNVSMGLFSQLKNTDDVREFVFNEAMSMGAKNKRAFNLAKDWVGDPLGTGPFMKFLANVRSAYRFAKYSLLSPVSGTLMYLNSVVMSEPLLWAKRSGLALYYNDSNFKKLIQEEGVTSWLERDSDLILQGANGMQMNGLAVDNAINTIANAISKPFGERVRKKIQAVALGGIHTIYDMQRSGAVREYAFAQALKQNRVETKEAIEDLLKKVHSGEIKNKQYATKRRSIMADTEENYARFFSNANTTAMSRHRWSRAFGFNFLQGYVVNRADEMAQGVKKFYNFVRERGAKNLTWDDVTYHLAHDNVELKSFLNNIILTTKLGYYLDRVDDADGSPSKNMAGYFVDANDYLSSLDTVWFMRLFKTIPNGIGDYMEYADYAKIDPSASGAAGTVAYELTAEVCSQFFREGKFLNAIMQTVMAGMKTGDLDFAATVAGVEWEKMSNGLGRFGLVDGIEKYGLEDFSEPSDMIGSILFSTNKTSTTGRISDKMWALSNVDKVINDPGYAAVTAIGYLPLVGEILKSATDNGGFNFTEAKYKEMMNMVENDEGLQELYRGKLNTEPYTDEAITRIWADFTSFNYPAKYEKSPGKHAVGSYIDGKDTTLNSMKEDVFVQNICEKMGISIEEFHNLISSDSAKTTGKLKVAAAAEAAEPGSGKIVLSYMMANRLYELEKQYTGKNYPTAADVGDEAMNQLKRIVLEEMGEGMFTADKVSWYKAIREYISIKNPDVFNTLYKNETLNSYVGSIGFLDSLMRDAAQKGDVDAKYIKNAWSVLTKYMTNVDARTSAVEYLFSQAAELNIPSSARHMVMEGILAGNIDFYNTLKNSPALSSIYADTLRDFEERLWGTLDEVDIVDDSYRRQNYKKTYTPYTSNYGDRNGQVEDDLMHKANKYFPKSSGSGKYPGNLRGNHYTAGGVRPTGTLNWLLKYYEGLIKDYSDRLVKSTGKKYPAQGTENITFKTGSNNRGSIKGQQLTFPKHKSKQYRTNVISNLPGSHG